MAQIAPEKAKNGSNCPKQAQKAPKNGSNYTFCGPMARFDDISPYILGLNSPKTPSKAFLNWPKIAKIAPEKAQNRPKMAQIAPEKAKNGSNCS